MVTAILATTGFFGNLEPLPILLYIVAWALMLAARVVLGGNQEFISATTTTATTAAPAATPNAAPSGDEYVPPPAGRFAYAGWLLARMSWGAFIAICILIFVTASYIAQFVKPKDIALQSDARPVSLVVTNSS